MKRTEPGSRRAGERARDGWPQEACYTLFVAADFSDLEKFRQIAQVNDGMGFGRFSEELLAALLPHPKSELTGDETSGGGGPKGGGAEMEIGPPPRPFVHERGFA